MFDAQGLAGLVKQHRAVRRAVVGQKPLDLHAQGRVVRNRSFFLYIGHPQMTYLEFGEVYLDLVTPSA